MSPTIPPGLEDVLSIDPEIMHGALCFKGTRLPLNVLLDNQKDGMGIDAFVEEYETDRDKIVAFVEWQIAQARRLANIGPED